VTESSDPSLGTPPLVGSSRASRWSPWRGPVSTVDADAAPFSLTDLSSMVGRIHMIRSRGGVADEIDRRLAGIVEELESLMHDLQGTADHTSNGDAAPRIRLASTDAADSPDPTAEVAFQLWLTGGDKAEVVSVGDPNGPPTPLTDLLGTLVLSSNQLSGEAAASLGMPSGTTVGYAAGELLLAVIDPTGPRCRSYRSALYYLRERDGTVLGL
jgi:hypothetical protein